LKPNTKDKTVKAGTFKAKAKTKVNGKVLQDPQSLELAYCIYEWLLAEDQRGPGKRLFERTVEHVS